MTPEEIRAILTISLLAAYADSHKHEREREEIRRIAEGLAQSEEVNLPSLYQDVLLKRTNLATAAAALTSVPQAMSTSARRRLHGQATGASPSSSRIGRRVSARPWTCSPGPGR